MQRDVILTAYASSAQAPCAVWAKQYFLDEPIVLVVPGSDGTFFRKGRQWASSGDAFRAALQELAPKFKDVEIRRRGLVTFSGGWQLANQILLQEESRVDAYILQDGLHTKDLDPWIQFAKRAAAGEAWMVMAHTQIHPPYVSAKETNSYIFREAFSEGAIGKAIPDYLSNPIIPAEGVKVTVMPVRDALGNILIPAQTKMWTKDSLVQWESSGNLYRLEYSGKDRTDHVYIAYHAAPRLWRMLGEYWMTNPHPSSVAPQTLPHQP